MSGSKKICKALLCLAAACCLTACAAKEQPAEELLQPQLQMKISENKSYETVTVESGDHVKQAQGSTSVMYLLQTPLSWDRDETYFVKSLVKRGDQVREGQVLMEFEVRGSKTHLQSLKLQAQRLYEDSEANKRTRLQALEEKKQQTVGLEAEALRVAELELEILQADYDAYVYQTNLQLSDLWKQIGEIEADLEDDVLVAPFDGVVQHVERMDEGDLVIPGQALVYVCSTDRLLLSAKDSTGNLRYNMPVTIETGVANKPVYLTGRVVAAPNVVPNGLSQPLTLIELDDAVTEKDLNGSLKYRCTTEELINILAVDGDLVQKENDSCYVYVLEGDTVQKRYLTVGTKNSDAIWILDGLTEGQTVVVN